MPSEAKRGRPPKNPNIEIIKRGNRTWKIDKEELRIRQGSVDEHGIRRTVVSKDPEYRSEAHKRITVMTTKYGYKVDNENSDEWNWVLMIPQAEFEKRERQEHELALSRRHRTKGLTQEDGLKTSLEDLQRMTPKDFQEQYGSDDPDFDGDE